MQGEMDRRSDPSRRPQAFATTRWSLVAAAGTEARTPLAELCARYWYPVFAYARRCGHPPDVAQTITHAFFHHLVGERLRRVTADPPKRFREWLLAELAHFVAHDWHGVPPAQPMQELVAPMPTALLEQRHRAEGNALTSADQGFRRSFALEVLSRALNRLRREAQQAGREAMFEQLEPYLTVEPGPGQYESMAGTLGTRPLSLVVALKRLRQRFRELADEELAETVASAEDLDAERAALHSALLRGA
jgi:RNA polymerase sigma-70 factor (ECF subfamily)